MGAAGERSRRIQWADVTAAAPELVVVAPCGYGLADAAGMAADVAAAAVPPPGAPVLAVDANAVFVRPGPRLVDGIEALAAIVHPGAFPARNDLAVRAWGLGIAESPSEEYTPIEVVAMGKARVVRPLLPSASRLATPVPSRARPRAGSKGEDDPAPAWGSGQDYFVEWQLGPSRRMDVGGR